MRVYLEGILGDPSLTKINGKTQQNLRKTNKTQKKIKNMCLHYCSLVFLCFDPWPSLFVGPFFKSVHMSDGKCLIRNDYLKNKPLFQKVFGPIWEGKYTWNNSLIIRKQI